MLRAIDADRQILVCLKTGKRNDECRFKLTGQTIHRKLKLQKDNRLAVKPRIKHVEQGRK